MILITKKYYEIDNRYNYEKDCHMNNICYPVF